MTWTRATYLSMARHYADAENSTRWNDVSHVTPLLGVVHRAEWQKLLDVAPDHRAATRSVTPDANAQVTFASLSVTTADAQQVLYKVRQVRGSAGRVYGEVEPIEWLAANSGGAGGTGVWWRQGTVLQFLTGDVGASLTVAVNYLPTPADLLSADTVAVDWPEGHELILVWETAALMLAKGATETEQAADLKALAAESRERLNHSLARASTRPTFMRYGDAADTWGGL